MKSIDREADMGFRKCDRVTQRGAGRVAACVTSAVILISQTVAAAQTPEAGHTAAAPESSAAIELAAPDDVLHLAHAGQSEYRVVIAEQAEQPIPAVADEFVMFFEKITGARLPIVTDARPMRGKEIIIGPSKHLDSLAIYIDWEELGSEGYVIRTVGNCLVLFGGPRRGTLNAVYTFLEDVLGCRWYTPTFDVIPQTPDLVIEPLHTERVPEFESRLMTDYAASDPAWAARQRVNTFTAYNIGWLLYDDPLINPKKLPHNLDGIRAVLADPRLAKAFKFGCQAGYSWAHMHTMGPGSFSDFFPMKKYLEEHPEYYGMTSEGIRDPDPGSYRTMCLTNPDVFRITVERAKEYLGRIPGANIVSVSNDDSHLYCECQRCKEAGKKYTYTPNKNPLGYFPYAKLDSWTNPSLIRPAWDPAGFAVGATGVLLDFVNRVAEELQKDHPGVWVHTFAYHWTMYPPDDIQVHPNVVIDVAPWVQCSYHTLAGCAYNEAFHGWWTAVRRWRKLTPHVWLWRYDQGRHQGMLPRPTLKNLAPQFREMAQAGVRGAQLHSYLTFPWMCMSGLRTYLIAKLMWDPWYDAEKGTREFVKAYYGPAAKEILAYLAESQDASSYVGTNEPSWKKFKGFHSSMSGPDIRPEMIRKWDTRFDRAEAAAAEQPNYLKRVREARLPIDFSAVCFLDDGDPVRVRALREFPARAREAGMKDDRCKGLLEQAAK